MSTLWSGRFDSEPNAAVFDFGASFRFDRRLFEDDVIGSLAWARGPGDGRRAVCGRCRGHDGGARPRFSRRGRPTRRGSPGPTRTCTRLSNGSWWSASAMPAAGCTPAARATSRCRSICGCSSAGDRRSLQASVRAVDRGLRRAGRALRRRADAGVHAPAARAAGAHRALPARARRRDAPRSHAASRLPRPKPTRCRLARAPWPAPTTRSTPRRSRRTLGLLARRRQQHRRLVRSRLRVVVPARVRVDDGAPEPLCRGHGHLQRRGVRVLRAVGRVVHRQQHDAAEEEPRSAGARARQDGPRHRPSRRMARDDEGAAERVQQGPAGRQGSGLRRRSDGRRIARGGGHRRGGADGADRARGAGGRRACCWRPTSPTTWSARACRFGARTNWSAR